MEFLGYISALFVGLSLGLVGSGGSILAVPILVYLFKIKNMEEATHYSMFVVGTTAFIGAFRKYQEKLVDLKTAVYFLIPSLLSLFFTRKIILPLIPKILFSVGNLVITKDVFLLLLFAVIMLLASYSMYKNAKEEDVDCFNDTPKANQNHLKTCLAALLVGMLTALLGAGGGFLIVPILILLKEHCMRRAIGTSLVIITINSLVGFIGDLNTQLNWKLLIIFTLIAVTGMMIGIQLSKKLDGAELKKMSSMIILLMGIYIILKELLV